MIKLKNQLTIKKSKAISKKDKSFLRKYHFLNNFQYNLNKANKLFLSKYLRMNINNIKKNIIIKRTLKIVTNIKQKNNQNFHLLNSLKKIKISKKDILSVNIKIPQKSNKFNL